MIGPRTDVQRQSSTTYISLRPSLDDAGKCIRDILHARTVINMSPIRLLTGALLVTATAADQLEWDHEAYLHSPGPTKIPNCR